MRCDPELVLCSVPDSHQVFRAYLPTPRPTALLAPWSGLRAVVLLSVGDEYGSASRAYLLEEISQPYTITENGRVQRALPFTRPRQVVFPAPLGARAAYLLPFSDQVFFPQTLQVPAALSRLALDPTWLAPVASLLVRTGIVSRLAARSTNRARSQKLLHWLQDRYPDRDRYGLVVEVSGPEGSVRGSLTGKRKATVTALGAAAVIRALADGEIDTPGLWLAEQVVPIDRFLERLAQSDIVPQFELSGSLPGATARRTPAAVDTLIKHT
jgi:saccharopine dehydrogenase-like NADP-dependent oxidoreductase